MVILELPSYWEVIISGMQLVMLDLHIAMSAEKPYMVSSFFYRKLNTRLLFKDSNGN